MNNIIISAIQQLNFRSVDLCVFLHFAGHFENDSHGMKFSILSNVHTQMHMDVVFVCRDKRAKVDPKEYMIDGKNGETFYKLPGSINGQQFIIQNCEVR